MDCLGIMDISRLDCHEVGVMSSVPLIDNHKCPVFSKGHDWDGSTCLACGYTSSRIYLERIAELEAQLTELRGELTTVQNAHSKALANNTALRKWITKLEGK